MKGKGTLSLAPQLSMVPLLEEQFCRVPARLSFLFGDLQPSRHMTANSMQQNPHGPFRHTDAWSP